MNRIIIIIIFAFLATTYTACTKFDETDEQEFSSEELPDQESWDNNIYFTRDGNRKAVLNAGYIAKYNKKRYTLLESGVRVNFYDDNGNMKSVLTSEQGKVYDERQDMIATGNVVVKSGNGTHLYSQELFWQNKEGKIISKVPVMITTATDTLYGDSFRSDPDLVDYEITNTRGTSQKTISIDE
ncbi:MAG: LPS export ABC transporter periplasmic protein LptC [Calditrichales bacterium]|nr:MAG: LPS export ABC transporter periplasmic protein LptC [Calditrichales bacterium]